jgi:hypothetical protein
MLTTVKTEPLLTVHNPVGYPPTISRKQPAARLSSLDGKTVYLVDTKFDDSVELLRQVQAWFARRMPACARNCGRWPATTARTTPTCGTRSAARGTPRSSASVTAAPARRRCPPMRSRSRRSYGVPTVAIAHR